MTVFGKKLVVLPFRRENAIDDGDSADIKPMSNSGSGSKSLILASYMIVLKDFIDKIDNIIDIQFLHGYYEPTLLILYEPLKTFSGYCYRFKQNGFLNYHINMNFFFFLDVLLFEQTHVPWQQFH